MDLNQLVTDWAKAVQVRLAAQTASQNAGQALSQAVVAETKAKAALDAGEAQFAKTGTVDPPAPVASPVAAAAVAATKVKA